jgi:hypothetical protein
MAENLRRMSLEEATVLAKGLALAYAQANHFEGQLLSVAPDRSARRIGKVPVTWGAVFTAVHRGVEFDGPLVLSVNLEARTVGPFVA